MGQKCDFAEVLRALREPFPPDRIRWKPQKVSTDGRAMAVAYVDSRVYQARLDEVTGGDWEVRYEFLKDDGSLVKCILTVCGVTREDVGEADPEDGNTATSAVAQAFKRACASFGLGRYLYFLPKAWVDYDPKKKRIINPPALPSWAIPETGEGETNPDETDPELWFGKYKGKRLSEVPRDYLEWLVSQEPQTREGRRLITAARELLAS